jgi:hypothetical protein
MKNFDQNANTYTGSTDIHLYPMVSANDLTIEQINEGVWVEMLVYRRSRTTKKDGVKKISKGYIIPSPYEGGINTLESELGIPLLTRGGIPSWFDTSVSDNVPLGVDRPNHYKVNAINEQIPVWEYLLARFCLVDIEYRNSSAAIATQTVLLPVSRRTYQGVNPTSRYAYSPEYTPMYIAFRYITWDGLANEGLGQFISGPISNTVTIAALKHPFIQDSYATSIFGLPCCEVNPLYDNTQLLCTIETKLP